MVTIFDPSHLLSYLVAALMISVFVMLFYNRLFYFRRKEAGLQSSRLSEQLTLVMEANKTTVWTFNHTKNLYRVICADESQEKEYTPIDFSQFYDRDDFLNMRKVLYAIIGKEMLSGTAYMHSDANLEKDGKAHLFEINLSVLRRDKKNRPYLILGTQRDITEEQEKAEKVRNLMLRYQTVFNSSLVDMVYYDGKGVLTDINQKAMETFGVENREALIRRQVRVTDIPAYKDIDIETVESVECTSITDISKIKSENERIPEVKISGKMYYETTVSTIRDEKGKMTGLFAAGRNITDMVESYHHQKESTRLVEKATSDIQTYIDNINYSLRVSDVRLMNYYPASHDLEIFSDLSKTQYRLPQLRAITLLRECDRRKAKGLFRRMDRLHPGVFSGTLQTLMRDDQGRDVYLTFNVMPVTDKEGHVTHYFGMCRNETERIYTEIKLQEETAKAQETEKLKDLFLFNMSYELRTPLNAVIGFAELFKSEHSPEDEPIFAEEIKKNTGDLLRLVNDILFISRLDSHMIEFSYQAADFATLFDGWCYMGWTSVTPGVKTLVENPYDHLMVKVDTQYLAMVIQKICSFAAASTHEGTIRAKYEYRHNELMITIEDTGSGIDAEVLPKLFDRFVRDENNEAFGSGLDLPIVKELVEQMGGSIEVQSEKDNGTTAFVNIPCENMSFKKKSEIII